MAPTFALRPLAAAELPVVHAAMLDAFADYPIPMQPSAAAFERLVRRRGVDWSLSLGAFAGSTLVGFTLTARAGSLAYDVISGVRRAWQGQGLIRRLFAELLPLLRSAGVEVMQLEVIASNARAIRAYEAIGFVEQRRLVCLRGGAPHERSRAPAPELTIVDAPTLDWPTWTRWWSYPPAWPSGIATVERTSVRLQLEARWRERPVGYLLAGSESGDLLQLAVDPDYRGRGLGGALIRAAIMRFPTPTWRTLNVDSRDSTTLDWLRAIPGEVFVEQLELSLDIA